jgi:hypothetical protein
MFSNNADVKFYVKDITVVDSNIYSDFFHETEMIIYVPQDENPESYIYQYILENLEVDVDIDDWFEVELYDVDFSFERI